MNRKFRTSFISNWIFLNNVISFTVSFLINALLRNKSVCVYIYMYIGSYSFMVTSSKLLACMYVTLKQYNPSFTHRTPLACPEYQTITDINSEISGWNWALYLNYMAIIGWRETQRAHWAPGGARMIWGLRLLVCSLLCLCLSCSPGTPASLSHVL